jgi:hypothetical protein
MKGLFMKIKDFLNKVVISTETKKRMYLCEITSPYFKTISVEPENNGFYKNYMWPTINGNAFENGRLVFEDESLTEPFTKAYTEYCSSRDAYWEDYGYWFRKD